MYASVNAWTTRLRTLRRVRRSLCTAWISTGPSQIFDANLASLSAQLSQRQPLIPVKGESVTVLRRPQDFYQTLLSMIRGANKRIFLSSLYMGQCPEILDALAQALASNPALTLDVQLDLLRSTRPEHLSAAELLVPLAERFPHRARIFLFRSPKLKGLLARFVPRRFDEGWGTWHAKIYGADDKILISGANLNETYFNDRQDRYMLFSQEPELARYCDQFISVFRRFSYRLRPGLRGTPYELEWSNSNIHPRNFEMAAFRAVTSFQSSWKQRATELGSNTDTILFPILQAGYLGVREEEHCLVALLNHVRSAKHDTYLTSGYFGLPETLQALIIRAAANCHIIAAGPKANGFYGSAGISGRIPDGYTLLERRFWRSVAEAGRTWRGDSGIQLSEWERPGWTYHAKGIWLSPAATALLPNTTLFGSTNLNSRSANLDTELSFALLTSCGALRQQLAEELEALQLYASPVDDSTWKRSDRRLDLWTKFLVASVHGML